MPLRCYAQPEATAVSPAPHLEALDTDSAEISVNQIQKASSLSKIAKTMYKWLKFPFNFFKLKYYFVAQNASNCDIFYGLIQDNPFIGRASVDIISAEQSGHGVAQVTHLPHGGGTVGQEGYIKVKCSDGRTMKGRFRTDSLTTGSAEVSDNLGNNYQCTFGHTAEQAVQRVNELRRELGCEECDAALIELKVNAEILQK